MKPPRPSRFWKAALLGALVCALAAWLIYNWRANRFDESELRDTAGIQAAITQTSRAPQGILIAYTIENRSQKTASSIVLTAQILDPSNTQIAVNPLINVLTLAPGEKRALTALVPFLPNIQPASTFKPILQITLVRWME